MVNKLKLSFLVWIVSFTEFIPSQKRRWCPIKLNDFHFINDWLQWLIITSILTANHFVWGCCNMIILCLQFLSSLWIKLLCVWNEAHRVFLPRWWRVSALYPAAAWTGCVRRPAAALRPRPWRRYWDLTNMEVSGSRHQPQTAEKQQHLQAQGMWGKMTSMLIFSLSPRDVST